MVLVIAVHPVMMKMSLYVYNHTFMYVNYIHTISRLLIKQLRYQVRMKFTVSVVKRYVMFCY